VEGRLEGAFGHPEILRDVSGRTPRLSPVSRGLNASNASPFPASVCSRAS
jgi:hypothetical protein